MTKITKRKKAIMELDIDFEKSYPVEEALDLLSKTSSTKFKESVDIAVNLGVDPRKSDQMVRGTTTLPNGTGKDIKVAVFADTDVDALLAAGADVVGMEDLAEKMKKGDLNYGVVLASPKAMPVVGSLGPLLGPRGLMPNPKMGTITDNLKKAILNAKSGQMRYRVERNGIVHGSVGKIEIGNSKLKENIESVLYDLKRNKPSTAKGVYIKKITLSTTMGIGLSIAVDSLSF